MIAIYLKIKTSLLINSVNFLQKRNLPSGGSQTIVMEVNTKNESRASTNPIPVQESNSNSSSSTASQEKKINTNDDDDFFQHMKKYREEMEKIKTDYLKREKEIEEMEDKQNEESNIQREESAERNQVDNTKILRDNNYEVFQDIEKEETEVMEKHLENLEIRMDAIHEISGNIAQALGINLTKTEAARKRCINLVKAIREYIQSLKKPYKYALYTTTAIGLAGAVYFVLRHREIPDRLIRSVGENTTKLNLPPALSSPAIQTIKEITKNIEPNSLGFIGALSLGVLYIYLKFRRK